jgi:hypothetical protein
MRIEVSIFMLHNRTKMDLSIAINNVTLSVLQQTKVFFDAIGDALLVYVPGHYIQLVDCGQDHGTCMGITLVGKSDARCRCLGNIF